MTLGATSYYRYCFKETGIARRLFKVHEVKVEVEDVQCFDEDEDSSAGVACRVVPFLIRVIIWTGTRSRHRRLKADSDSGIQRFDLHPHPPNFSDPRLTCKAALEIGFRVLR